MDLIADYGALRHDVGAVEIARDVLSATGPDTDTFLQGQLSQDVAAIPVGGSAWSLLLQPQGKLEAWLGLSRLAPDELLLDVDGGWGEAVLARLQRFKLRTRCDLAPLAGWRGVALRGPNTSRAVENAAELADAGPAAATVVADAAWPGLAGVDLLGPDVRVPAGVRRCGLDAYHAVRIECGVPMMGAELDTATIPAEAGIVDRSVSWTKGCYTGQELVARIDSRGGNVPRRLTGVVLAADVTPPVGATIHAVAAEADPGLEAGPPAGADGPGESAAVGAEVGRLTSVARSVDPAATVALAYLRRAVTPPAPVTVVWADGRAPARVAPLPLR